VRKAQVGLKPDRVIQTALQNIGATERVLDDGDTARLHVSFREADAFILVAKLGNQTGVDITLQKASIYMNVPSELTTFIERAGIHCAPCVFE
jgi:hypothetical protein